MPIINVTNEFYSLGIQNRFATPAEFGQIVFGWSKWGDDNTKFGVYQRRIKRGNFWTKTAKVKKGVGYCREKYYYTANPRTPEQQANRIKFQSAVTAWHNLTPEEKEVYNKRAISLPKSGFNIYISEWVKSI